MTTAYPQAEPKSLDEFESVATSPHVKDFSLERKQSLIDLVKNQGDSIKLLKFHQSICPGCVEESNFNEMKIDALTYAKNDKVWQIKKCNKHGVFKEVSWSSFEIYKRAEQYQDPGVTIENPKINKKDINCPADCGLCNEHESHTNLGNIVVTNRCDLSCWYCFFYAKKNDPIYEPSMDQLKAMLKNMRDTKPIGANSVQFTGGEPTLREDIVEIVKAAKDLGYSHIQLNTNGINLAKSPELCKNLKEAGVSNLYLSFDGVTVQTNPKNYWEAPKAIENCHKAGIGVVLVPTVIGGINDHEIGDILRFAAGNIHAVRSVNYQPVSLVGQMPDKMRRKQRITIPTTMKRIEEQTDGQLTKDDFFPIPCAKNVTNFVEIMKNKPKYRLSTHFQCGMATYVFKEGDKLIPLPQFFDVQGFFEYLGNLTEGVKQSGKLKKYWSVMKLMKKIGSFVDDDKKPKDLKFSKILAGVIGGGDYHGLAEFHQKSLFVGMMHFQDPYNWDIDRVHKCSIHYATPDGSILPFCTFNVIPELYRDKIQRAFSISQEEWENKTGKKLADDAHKRNYTPDQIKEIDENYARFRRPADKATLEDEWGNEEGTENTMSSENGSKPKHPAGGCGSC
ncbi:tetraether lipid synthase Tes [Candidatus Aenigmatarchaeota archaeon]